MEVAGALPQPEVAKEFLVEVEELLVEVEEEQEGAQLQKVEIIYFFPDREEIFDFPLVSEGGYN